MIKILANDGIEEIGEKLLQDAGFSVISTKIKQEDLIGELKHYDAILVRSATKIRRELIDACPGLKLIGRGGVGLDNIDVDYAKQKGIKVINTPAASSISVAELVFAHLFSCSRSLQFTNRQMPLKGNSDFNSIKKSASAGVELNGKTMGIYGFGRIGQEVAKIAIGLGMNIVAFDPYLDVVDISLNLPALGSASRIKVSVKMQSEEALLSKSDFITFHVPFTGGAKPLIDMSLISKMKKGAGIVNCARGGVIAESDIIAALDSGQLAFAGLDVFEGEPAISQAIINHPKISLSPHIGGSTMEAQNRIGIELAQKVIDFFKR